MSNYGSLDTTISEICVLYFQRYNTLLFNSCQDPAYNIFPLKTILKLLNKIFFRHLKHFNSICLVYACMIMYIHLWSTISHLRKNHERPRQATVDCPCSTRKFEFVSWYRAHKCRPILLQQLFLMFAISLYILIVIRLLR